MTDPYNESDADGSHATPVATASATAVATATPTEVDILNRFRELQGLTPIQLRLWRRLWLEWPQSVRRSELFAEVFAGTSGNAQVDRHLFDSHLTRLRRSLEGRGWEVIRRPAPRGDARYSVRRSDDPEGED